MTEKGRPSQQLLDTVAKSLPEYFPRNALSRLTNGLLSSKTLTNLNHNGKGPPVHYMARKAVYLREEFVPWMTEYYGGMNVYHDGTCLRVHRSKETADGLGEESDRVEDR